jgi:diguanylate cyclase (GGDEF)-like protein
LLVFEYQHWDVLQVATFVAVGLTTAMLTDDRRRLRLLATTDDLTGLHNLRSFEERLAAMIRERREARTPLALLVIDVDRLKSLNDTYGHLAGADAVRTVGHVIRAVEPSESVACRYGGDEFVLALPGSAAAAHHLAREIARAVYATAPVLAGLAFPVRTLSVSVGVSCSTFDEGTRHRRSETQLGEELFRAADAALYRAKAQGRNRVQAAS